jgi:hypothetical protein
MKDGKETLRHWWDFYQTMVIPRGASQTQIVESRRAFYGGAKACFSLLTGLVDMTTDEPTEADLAKMSEINREIEEFYEDIEKGRA